MSSKKNRDNALKVLADTASDDELRNRYDAAKHAGNHQGNKVDYSDDSTSSLVKEEDDESGGRGSDGSSSSRKAEGKAKKDGWRKGKWMEEEEEYTTRVIHHFSSGLITLPEGKTLRTFLADKLQCDPMRITKKYAGASCLSKKIHSLCERPQFTPQEVEAARMEIERLEERFLLRLEHGPGAVLPPMKTPVSIAGSVTSSTQNSTSYAPAASVPGAINQNPLTSPQALALLAFNAQLAATANHATALPFGPAQPNNTNVHLHQSVPAPSIAPALTIPQVLQMPALSLQALLSHSNLVKPTNLPATDPVNSQQLTLSLVSQLLTQLQTLATVSPGAITQLQNQLVAAVAPPAPPPTQNTTAGIDIASLLQSIQGASQAAIQGIAAGNSGTAPVQMMPQAIPAGLTGQSNTIGHSASSQFSYPLTFQVLPPQISNNPKQPNNPISELLAQLQRGHDDAAERARKEAKKRKKFTVLPHSSSSLMSGATVISSGSGPRSKNPFDTEGSSSSTDLPTSDAAKGCESSSSNSCSDEEKDMHKGPLRKRFKASLNGGMTHRALQDHDERMARNANN